MVGVTSNLQFLRRACAKQRHLFFLYGVVNTFASNTRDIRDIA